MAMIELRGSTFGLRLDSGIRYQQDVSILSVFQRQLLKKKLSIFKVVSPDSDWMLTFFTIEVHQFQA
jgi:hypothetical protein